MFNRFLSAGIAAVMLLAGCGSAPAFDVTPEVTGEAGQDEAGQDEAGQDEAGLTAVETTRGGAPQFTAFRQGPGGRDPVDYYTVMAPDPAVKTGHFVLVNKRLNALWHYRDGKLVKAYRVATGRQTEPPAATWEDYRNNFFTPEGQFTLTKFVVDPPYNALKPGDVSYPGGSPGNPLGTRWMGFSVLPGDQSGIWGIHGTSEPQSIGTWASDGCIRMHTAGAEELFAALREALPVPLHVVER